MKKTIVIILIIFSVPIFIFAVIKLSHYSKNIVNNKTIITITSTSSDPKYQLTRTEETKVNIKDKISITVPDYETQYSDITGYNHVSVPEGTMILEPDRPEIPIYKVTINYPEDYKIQNVSLINKSGLKKEKGLNLPPVRIEAGSGMKDQNKINICYANETGWYPQNDFSWYASERPGGTTDLIISIYPFHYNTKTKESEFYKQFSFKIDYVKSDVRIIDLQENIYRYKPKEPVNFDLIVYNFGNEEKYYLESYFKDSSKIFEILEKKEIILKKGRNDFNILLESNYQLGCYETCEIIYEIKIVNKNKTLLDSETNSFRIKKLDFSN